MDWITVARSIAPLAPVLGGILGGFIPVPGAALAGQALGNVIARSLGVPATPEAVGAAVANPNEVTIAKLNAAMEEAKAQWPAIAEIEKAYAARDAAVTESVNATMRSENGREHWYFNGWRPMAGWLFNIFAAVEGGVLIVAVWRAGSGDTGLVDAIKDMQTIVGAHLGALAAVVGVYTFGRSREKGTALQAGTTATPAVLPKAAPLPKPLPQPVAPPPARDRHGT